MEQILKEKKGMRPMEFSVMQMIQRQLPIYWQKFFEDNLNLADSDVYQMHAFIIKRNRYFFNKKRFIVVTNYFIYNVEAEFKDKNCLEA